MTEQMLISVITLFCTGTYHPENGVNKKAREERIQCYETLVNCAVGPNGKIMTLKEFTEKCSKK